MFKPLCSIVDHLDGVHVSVIGVANDTRHQTEEVTIGIRR